MSRANGHRDEDVDARNGDEDGEPFEAETPKEYRARQRFDELQEVKAEVRAVKRKADEAFAFGHVSRHNRLMMVRRAVEDYIQELRPMILEADPELREYYWHEVDLGEMQLPNGGTRSFHGLASYLGVNGPVVTEWVEVDDSGYGTPTPAQRREKQQIPRHISEAAQMACDEFRIKVGLGAPRREPDPHGIT